MRTMPMPPRPGGVATAAMVSRSRFVSPSGLVGVRGTFNLACDEPLLRQRKQVVDEPVEYETCGEEEEHDGEHDRHEFHHTCLNRIRHGWVEGLSQEHRAAHQDREHKVRVHDC